MFVSRGPRSPLVSPGFLRCLGHSLRTPESHIAVERRNCDESSSGIFLVQYSEPVSLQQRPETWSREEVVGACHAFESLIRQEFVHAQQCSFDSPPEGVVRELMFMDQEPASRLQSAAEILHEPVFISGRNMVNHSTETDDVGLQILRGKRKRLDLPVLAIGRVGLGPGDMLLDITVDDARFRDEAGNLPRRHGPAADVRDAGGMQPVSLYALCEILRAALMPADQLLGKSLAFRHGERKHLHDGSVTPQYALRATAGHEVLGLVRRRVSWQPEDSR